MQWELPFVINVFLPSATKLRRLCFHRRVSVHRGVWSWGGACSRGWCLLPGGSGPKGGVPDLGGCLLWGLRSRGVPPPGVCGLGVACSLGGWSQGVPALGGRCGLGGACSGGMVSQHALRQTPLG